MKTKIIFPTLFLFVAGVLTAQDCTTFFPFKQGATIEYTHYDKKDKVSASTMQKITLVEDKGDAGISATIEAQINDKKGEEAMTTAYDIRCQDNTLYMDITAMMPELTQSFGQMEIEMTGDDLQLPSRLTVGQALPDATMQIKAGTGGMSIMNMTIEIVDRKVEGRETVETPAGTFDCYKINQTTKTKMLVSKTFTSTEWYAEGVGIVKSESYDKKGNVESYSLLTRFSKE